MSDHVFRTAAGRTVAARSARVSVAGTMIVPSTGKTWHLREQGVANFAKRAAAITVTFTGLPAAQVRAVGGTLYERLAGHSRWTRMSLPGAGARTGVTLGSAAPLSPGNAATVLNYLNDPATTVTSKGTQRADGVPATHYHGVIDAPASVIITVDVWVDKQGRVRKAVITVPQPAVSGTGKTPATAVPAPSGRAQRGLLHLTVTLTDFGVRATVPPPPSAQTSSLPTMGG